MKRIFSLFTVFTIMLFLCACQGNFESINLKDPIQIPDDGIITRDTIQQITNENAIAVFIGTCGDFTYKWTIFASNIEKAKEVNLKVQLSETASNTIRVELSQAGSFGFSALLSVHLNEQWDAQSATASAGDRPVASVSLTGSNCTILNITLDGSVRDFIIYPDTPSEDHTSEDPADGSPEPDTPSDETGDATEDPADGSPEPDTPSDETGDATEDTTNTPAEKDQYLTDPVPEGKPDPVEPESQNINKGNAYTCTFSIECSTILNNLDQLDPEKLEIVPSDGAILAQTAVTFYEGESVFDVLKRLCIEKGIHMEASWTPIYNSAYVEGIHNLYEFDCGALSGWMYKVNDWYPNYGSSRYQLQDGDEVQWRYTCDLGNDVGGSYAIGG